MIKVEFDPPLTNAELVTVMRLLEQAAAGHEATKAATMLVLRHKFGMRISSVHRPVIPPWSTL